MYRLLSMMLFTSIFFTCNRPGTDTAWDSNKDLYMAARNAALYQALNSPESARELSYELIKLDLYPPVDEVLKMIPDPDDPIQKMLDFMVNDPSGSTENQIKTNTMNITIGDKILTATLVDNSSVAALIDALSEGPITVDMRDYGNMEKVGSLGRDFPRNDERITTEPGDIILFQGSALVIYYAPNTWSFTRLGKIDNITQEVLKDILGKGNVTAKLSLP